MLNSRTFLLIRNDSWIFNNFLMLYCRIHRKYCFVIKLFITVVDFAMRRLFICFQSSRIFLTFWLNVSESAQMSSHLSRYSCKRKNRLIFSWSLLFVRLIHQQFNCIFSTQLLLSLRNSLNWKNSLNLKSSETARRVHDCI